MDSQTQLKIDLELIFIKELTTLFNRIRLEYRTSVVVGQPIRADVYEAAFSDAIEKHYRRVQKAFQGKAGVDISDEDIIFAALVLWAIQNSSESAIFITDTTQKNFDASLSNARQALSNDGVMAPSARELAAVSSSILARVFSNRATRIATIETQRSAESTKLIEAYEASGLDPTTLITPSIVDTPMVGMIKHWFTVGDDRVRPAHRVANGQKKPVDQPFIVAGERLMYPGDTSLGASMANVAECRCGTRYERTVLSL